MKLKTLLEQVNREDFIKSLLSKIKQKQYDRIGAGDNGIVSHIKDTDYVFKVTRERSEYDVAKVIVGREEQFNCFIPVVYVSESDHMYIMKQADNDIPQSYNNDISKFKELHAKFINDYDEEISYFEFLDTQGSRNTPKWLIDFLRRLQRQVELTGIEEFDLDIDFKSDNVMIYNNRPVLVDW